MRTGANGGGTTFQGAALDSAEFTGKVKVTNKIPNFINRGLEDGGLSNTSGGHGELKKGKRQVSKKD